MATLIIVGLFFLVNIYSSIQYGVVEAMVRVGVAVLGFLLARAYYLPLAERLALLIPYPGYTLETTYVYFPPAMLQSMDTVFFRMTAFILIIAATAIVAQAVFHLLKGFRFYRLPAGPNQLAGIISGIALTWYALFFVFAFLSVLALASVQGYLDQSAIADFFIRRTPFLSKHVFNIVLTGIGEI